MRFAFPMPAYHMHSRSGACGFPLVLLQAIQGTQFWRTVGVMSANNGCARDVGCQVAGQKRDHARDLLGLAHAAEHR